MPAAIRTTLLGISLLLLLLAGACAKKKITPFELFYDQTRFKVEPNDIPGARIYTNQVLTSSIDSFLQLEGIPRDEFKSARALSVQISMEDSAGVVPFGPFYNFNSFDSLSLIMSAPDVRDVITIARKVTVPKGVQSFTMDTVGVDVVNMLRQSEFKLELRGRAVDTVYVQLPVRLKVRYDCQAEKSR